MRGHIVVVAVGYLARPRPIKSVVSIELPSCQGGVYTSRIQGGDVFDRIADDDLKRECEYSKGLTGNAVLSAIGLTLEVHNPSAYPLMSAKVRLKFVLQNGTEFTREYKFDGRVPPLGDGSLLATANLDLASMRSVSGAITRLSFDLPK
jgi:hypothetical protein